MRNAAEHSEWFLLKYNNNLMIFIFQLNSHSHAYVRILDGSPPTTNGFGRNSRIFISCWNALSNRSELLLLLSYETADVYSPTIGTEIEYRLEICKFLFNPNAMYLHIDSISMCILYVPTWIWMLCFHHELSRKCDLEGQQGYIHPLLMEYRALDAAGKI